MSEITVREISFDSVSHETKVFLISAGILYAKGFHDGPLILDFHITYTISRFRHDTNL